MRAGLRALLFGCAMWWAWPAAAGELTLTPSPAGCMSPPAAQRGTPDYPEDMWSSGTPGRVLVELIFTGPDLRPEVKVLRSAGGAGFVESVRSHVRDFRLPCLESADIPARVQLDFIFKPVERKAVAAAAVDPDRVAQERQLACVVNAAGSAPAYPIGARLNGIQGRVVAELRFVSADGPPEITLLTRPASRDLLASVTRWAEQFRMPCHAGLPVQARRTLVYRFEGDQRYGFKKISLVEFLGGIRDLETVRVNFDFDYMGCPFEIRLQYLQPQRRNVVVQINEPLSARQPLIDWLAGAELRLSARDQDALFADTVVLAVPCGKFDLQPRGASSPPTPAPSTSKEKS